MAICLRAVKPSRSVEPFAFWVKCLFPQNFAESLIVLSSCLLRAQCVSVIHVRDTPNTQKTLVVIDLCIC